VTFAMGAAGMVLPLLAWSLLFSHPRFGMFSLMAANQPEVRPGAGFAVFWPELELWFREAGSIFCRPWILTVLLSLSACSLALEARKKSPWLAWALVAPYGLLLFAFLHMRHFERYFLPLLAPLAFSAALLFRRI